CADSRGAAIGPDQNKPRLQDSELAGGARPVAAAVRHGVAPALQDRVATEPRRALGLCLLPRLRGRPRGLALEGSALADAHLLRVAADPGNVSGGDEGHRAGLRAAGAAALP